MMLERDCAPGDFIIVGENEIGEVMLRREGPPLNPGEIGVPAGLY